MNQKINEGIQEVIAEAVDKQLNAIRYNLCNVFGGLLYTLKLEAEKKGGVLDIDNLISVIIRTSHYDGPEGEQYPVWNEKECKAILDRWTVLLQNHDVQQSWNLGVEKERAIQWATTGVKA